MKKLELQNRKGQKIVGILDMPKGNVHGTCIVQHGYSGTKEQDHIVKIKDAFFDNDFITFNFDTTNSFGESDGDFQDARLGLHAEDLEDVAKWAQKQEWFQKPLALTGHSMGGYAVAKYAQDHADEVDLLALIAPVVSGRLSFEANEEKDQGSLAEWKERGYKEIVSKTTGNLKCQSWAMMEERLDHDLLPKEKLITMTTLLVAGTNDTSCRPQDVRQLYDALSKNEKNQFVEIEGAPHTYRTKEHLQCLYDAIDQWLKEGLDAQ